jgi:hypothetical protein
MSPTHDTDETDVRHALATLVTDEPVMGLRVERVVRDGRRLRLRRRAVGVGTPLVVLALVAAAVAWNGSRATPAPAVAKETVLPPVKVAAQSLPLTDTGRAAMVVPKHAVGSGAQALEVVVRQASPAGWTFTFDDQEWAGLPGAIDAVVNDGTADGYLSLASTRQDGMLTVHPCTDSEFRQGATCAETTRSDGSYLTVRGLVSSHGVETILVSITRRNGTGTFAEAGNYALPTQPASGTTVTAAQKAGYGPTITRPDPSYTVAQLQALVEAADAASRG